MGIKRKKFFLGYDLNNNQANAKCDLMTENEESENRFGMGTFVCVFNKDYTKIMLLYRNAEKRAKWGADWGNVGGVVEFGETSVQGAIREVFEETGLRLKPENLKLIAIRETLNFMPHLQAIHIVYSTAINEDTPIKLNAHAKTLESESYKWFDVDNLPERMLDPKEDILKWRDIAKSDYSIMLMQK